MAKTTFKPALEWRNPGDVTVYMRWDILRDGVMVGSIISRITDLHQDYANPGYSVMVKATIDGVVEEFYRFSGSFSNRSAREARSNRSYYVSQAKAWVKRKEAS